MTTTRKATRTESRRAWPMLLLWIFPGLALLPLVLEHPAHVLASGLLPPLGSRVLSPLLASPVSRGRRWVRPGARPSPGPWRPPLAGAAPAN